MMYFEVPPESLPKQPPKKPALEAADATPASADLLSALLTSAQKDPKAEAVSTDGLSHLLAQTQSGESSTDASEADDLPSLNEPPESQEERSIPADPQPSVEFESPSERSVEPEEVEPEDVESERSVEPEGLESEGLEPEDVGPERVEIEGEGSEDLTPAEFASQLRLTADFQEYNPTAQVVTARGNVVLQLNDAIIEADELWLNLVNRYVLADGDVLLTRGAQIVRGSRAEYNFIQQAGTVADAVGTLYLPNVEGDLRSPLEASARLRVPNQVLDQTSPSAARRAYDPINRELRVSSEGSVQIATSDDVATTGGNDGDLRQLRFETGELAFDVEGWRANDVRITNDPFSPPELELRANNLLLRNVSPAEDELLLKNPRLVFDQGLSLPLLRNRIRLSRGTVDPEDLNPVPADVGIDGRDRGGLFLGRKVFLVRRPNTELSVTPQFFIAKAFSDESSSPIALDNFGVAADLDAELGPRTTLSGSAELTSLNLNDFTERLRTSLRAEQRLGDHRLALQYSYRERLFNGSLGFQDVQSSFGAVLLSPDIALGGSDGPRLTYQASAQVINAQSDRAELQASSGRTTLGRFQASAALTKNFNLWRGQPKPPTQDEGLRFTPEPVVPYLDLTSGLRSTGTYYTSGDFQGNLIAEIGLEGQVGHLSRNFADYTGFNVGYSQSFIGGADSPFLFDREVDRRILSLGLTQQVYGPFLAGFQTAYSFSEGRAITTLFTLEYSRRTYGILLRYDTTQSTGAIGFRLSNFSWLGDTDPFDTPRVRRVQGSVIEQR